MSPGTVGLIITGLTAVGGFVGVLLSGIGKRGDQKAQQSNDQFNRLMSEIGYWHSSAEQARVDLARCQAGLPPLKDSKPPQIDSE